MKFRTKIVARYGNDVHEHPETDELRKTQCLCLNCSKLKPGAINNCAAAQAGFELCLKYHLAYMMTRCHEFDDKNASGEGGKKDETRMP